MENNPEFVRLADLAKSLSGDYGSGYKRGLRRRFYGARFGTDAEHEQWSSFEGKRSELTRGYLDALEGREPVGGGSHASQRADTWTPTQVRAWVDRHGGNVTECARMLRVPRTLLQAWLADPEQAASARPLPPYIQAHMEAVDRLARG